MLLTRALITAARAAMTDDPTRYYLKGMQVTQTEEDVTARATNGHLAVTVTQRRLPDADYPWPKVGLTPGTATDPILVPGDALDALLKVAPKRPRFPVIGAVSVGVTPTGAGAIGATDLDVTAVRSLDTDPAANFPDFARITPKQAEDDLTVSLTVAMLTDLLAVAKAIHAHTKSSHKGVVKLTVPRDAAKVAGTQQVIGAIRATMSGEDVTAECVVMPCR